MAISITTAGTQTCSVGQEHTLFSVTTTGKYIAYFDASALTNGDELESRIYEAAVSGAVLAESDLAYFANVQADDVKWTRAIVVNHAVKMTLKQTLGTGRSFRWELRSFD